MIYADFASQLRRTLEEPVANVWQDASLLYWTNEAARDMAARVRQNIDESVTVTTPGESDYSLPANTQEVTAVYFDGRILARENPESRYVVDDAAGIPVAYQRMDEVIRLRPTPSTQANLLIIRRAFPDTIDDGNSQMPFRSERNTAIEYFVLSRAFEQTGDFGASDAFRARYEAALITYENDANIAADAGVSSEPVQTY